MTMLDDCLTLGLPAVDDGAGGITFTRPLRGQESTLATVIRLKWIDANEQQKAFVARPDLAALYGDVVAKLGNVVDVDTLKAQYVKSVTALQAIIDEPAPSPAWALASIKTMARILILILRLIARSYKAV